MKHIKLFEQDNYNGNERLLSSLVEAFTQLKDKISEESFFTLYLIHSYINKIESNYPSDSTIDLVYIENPNDLGDGKNLISDSDFNYQNLGDYYISFSLKFRWFKRQYNELIPIEQYNIRYKSSEEFRRIIEKYFIGKFTIDFVRETSVTDFNSMSFREPEVKVSYKIKDFLEMRGELFKNINEE